MTELSPLTRLEDCDCVLFAHAHPDDESLATGALIAHLVRRGVRCVLVTATRGESGEVRPEALSELVSGTTSGALFQATSELWPGTVSEAERERRLIAVREAELTAACQALGISRRTWLGPANAPYRDSGMRWVSPGVAGPADDQDPRSFTARPMAAAVADLAGVIADFGAAAVVSYDAFGTYQHPDHVQLHHVVKAVAAQVAIPFIAVVSEAAEETSSWQDFPELVMPVRNALSQYHTQLTVLGDTPRRAGTLVRHVGGQEQPVYAGFALIWG